MCATRNSLWSQDPSASVFAGEQKQPDLGHRLNRLPEGCVDIGTITAAPAGHCLPVPFLM